MLHNVLAVGELACKTEICDLERRKAQLSGTKQKIFGLNVTMDDTLGVTIFQTCGNFSKDISYIILSQFVEISIHKIEQVKTKVF